MEWLLFSKLSIQIFTQFVLSLMITAYLVLVRGKSAPTKILLVFFSLFTLTLLGDLLQFSLDASWSFYVGAVQNGLGIASVVALMQFAGVAHEINNPIGVVNSAVDVSGRCIERIEGELVGPPFNL